MAVFTRITHNELQAWLEGRNCGTLRTFEGIESGIENTNYFVNTSQGRYVLTIFEKLQPAELPFYLGLMQHLCNTGLAVPGPIASAQGNLFSMLQGKPATLVNCLKGASVELPTESQCQALGEFLALAHTAVANFSGTTPNPRGLNWIEHTVPELAPYVPPALLSLLRNEVQHQTALAKTPLYAQLPQGAVHADLFRDNALMQGDAVGGVIDFYFAGIDTFLFDLAVTVNDWCIDLKTGELIENRLQAMLAGYAHHRPFSDAECALWQDMLRAAALRFWTSRLYDYYMPRQAEVLHIKDPSHFERVLLARRAGLPFNLREHP
jgi:homoserine kinase type II